MVMGILTGVWVTQVYTFVRTHGMIHLTSVHLILYKVYLKRKKNVNKY